MIFTRLIKSALVTGAVVMLFGVSAYAGTSMEKYSTTVGKFNGSGYASFQTKTYASDNGLLYSNAVGGKYTVDARMISSGGGKGRWIRDVDDNTHYSIPTNKDSIGKGDNVRLQFSNDLLTPVCVQVEGKWKSN
jgi:hypothetical protein